MNKQIKVGLRLLSLFIIFTACSSKEQADTIFINGKIYTVNSEFQIAQAIAVKNGKIIAVGSDSEILNYYDAPQITDLASSAVYPGFIDGHTHFKWYAEGLNNLNLVGTTSYQDVIKKIQKHIEEHPHQKWITGHGWDQNDWKEKNLPTKDTLDLLFPNKIIALTRIDGHALLTNQKGLEIAGITNRTKISGGEIILAQGLQTGVLLDAAKEAVLKLKPSLSPELEKKLIQKAERNCFSVGLTTLVEAGLNKNEIDLLDKMQKDSALQIRIYAMLMPTEENISYYFSKGHYKTDRMNVRSFKVFADGALGSRGACLLKPYADKPDTYGFLLSSPEVYDSLAKDFALKNFQMNTHAIGDSANRLITKIYGKYLKGRNDKRWRIEHAQIVNPIDIQKFRQFNILPSVQPTHAISDMSWVAERIGQDRLQDAYNYKTLLDTNDKIILGSDFPVEDINPLFGFHAAVSRQNEQNLPDAGFMSNEALSREQALKGMTIWAAYGQFEEEEKGSLEVGKFADFVILDQDIMQVEMGKIRETKVMQTWIGGKKVYQIQL